MGQNHRGARTTERGLEEIKKRARLNWVYWISTNDGKQRTPKSLPQPQTAMRLEGIHKLNQAHMQRQRPE